MTQKFPENDPKKSVNDLEKSILKFWQEKRIFQKTVDLRNPKFPFKFFDGPPFATGSPHYGHILAGTIKDAIPRYKTMQGYRVTRKWGWDCHGVPVEFQVEKEHQIGGKPGIEKMGVAKFNELCRSVVLRCADEWHDTVDRMGRFVDFKNDYKTMDPEFMESVWWVFSELWKKGLIYEGEKVVAYSPKLGSPLSNFEANLNYADIDDPAVTVKFELADEPGTYVLAWTTTPWTLPSNLGLCVNPKLDYVKVKKDGETYIVGADLAEKLLGEDIEVLEKISGKKLVGKKYLPVFPFFKDHKNAFQIFGDDFVTEDSGTGIVHMAPTGEDDARILQGNEVELFYPFTENCYFDFSETQTHRDAAKSVKELQGKYFRFDPEVEGSKENNANDWVIQNLGEKLFDRKQVRHSYPHCWRTDCALMYRGIKTWFVNVGKIKDQMIANNQKVNWIPDHLKDGRFGKILEGAPDWAISRNRYWGCPIPVWKCDKTGTVQVVKSRSELETLCGKPVDDLHKHFVDDLTWKNPKTGGTMRRIPEVLDCWFESGSMPYGSTHYPFEDSGQFTAKNNFYIARHGEAEQNVKGIYNTNPKDKELYGLTEEGREDVKESAKKFKGKVDVIFTSPFRRCRETASIIAKVTGAKVVIDERLREIHLGKFDGGPEQNLERFRVNDDFETGESLYQVQKRMITAIQEINQKHEGENIIILSHGGPLKTVKQWFNNEHLHWVRRMIQPGEIQKLTKKSAKNSEFKAADFIAEGLDQTRGWFYTLHVLGCALFGKNIYQNVITNGIILAEDGQKMSKSKKNYPDPNLIFEKYGADAMRFYLLSSPVVRGENFRFAEHGVEEVLKSVLLPLKSAYQFFSTYANIDGWQPTKLIFARHGEAHHNVHKIYSGQADNDHHLTEIGKEQVKETADNLPEFDAMVSSPFVRTRETAEMIKKISKFSGEILFDKRVQEPFFGDLEGKEWIPPLERYKNKTAEHPLKVQERVTNFIEDMAKKFRGQNLLIVSHGSPIRNAEAHQNHITELEDHIRIPYIKTAKYRLVFPAPHTTNELDQWILSELQTLLKKYRENFDAYDLEGALRHIAPFVDNLNNWYLRRSRRRFWASGVDADKISGYETLHHVLFTLSKILAPVCPFFADKLFQDLGGYGSVHLEFIPHANETWIKPELEKNIGVAREIVSLAAGIRARAKIKLRQPLGKLQFSTTEKVDLDLDVIKAEANVKDVEIISETELKKFAQKIVRVNAKLVGKKFGPKVQELIQKGKSGDFETLKNGQIKIAGEVLESDEYEVGFLTAEGVEAEATTRTVVLLDTEITSELEVEGMSRELVRAIQELRKNSGFAIADRITVTYSTESELIKQAFEKFGEKISEETLATDILSENIGGPEVEIDGEKLILKLTKQT